VNAREALAAFARDLVEEISAGRAVELAASVGSSSTLPGNGNVAAPPVPLPLKRGAAAVHPQLGQHLMRLPADTISGLAYQHMQSPQAPPIASA
jgi:hypothetical protein